VYVKVQANEAKRRETFAGNEWQENDVFGQKSVGS
jgi:hypothetical protein